MNADRFFYPAVLAACAALTVLLATDPGPADRALAPAPKAATPVVYLERVTITADRQVADAAMPQASVALR